VVELDPEVVVVVLEPDGLVVVVEPDGFVVVVLEPPRVVVEVVTGTVEEGARVVEVVVDVVDVVDVLWGSLRAARKTPIPRASTSMNKTTTAMPNGDDHIDGSAVEPELSGGGAIGGVAPGAVSGVTGMARVGSPTGVWATVGSSGSVMVSLSGTNSATLRGTSSW
jgi:hypothetical protein